MVLERLQNKKKFWNQLAKKEREFSKRYVENLKSDILLKNKNGVKMLTKSQIEQIAIDYLIKNEYPIVVSSATVILPEDENDVESKQYLEEMDLACVSFRSKYFDNPDPRYPLDPGVYIAYVNIITGEVDVPPHM